MKNANNKNKCATIRAKLRKAIMSSLQLNTGWMADHVATCPRCQKRLGNLARVNLAFSLLRSQTHSYDLFKNANTKAVNTLKHSLRNAPAADKLRHFQVRPNWFMRNYRPISSITSAAACIAILVLLKVSIFSSMDSLQEKGTDSLKRYYAKQLDEDIVNDIFTA